MIALVLLAAQHVKTRSDSIKSTRKHVPQLLTVASGGRCSVDRRAER
jgi:hypothetical protein